MSVAKLARAEEALQAAEVAYAAALQGRNPDEIAEAQGRVMKALHARTIAHHADEYGAGHTCDTCSGRASWDD